MSRNFAVLGKAGSPPLAPPASTGHGQFDKLIRSLFQTTTAVALVGTASSESDSISAIAESLASELAANGKRVIVVQVNGLLCMNPIKVPNEAAFLATTTPGVWIWSGQGVPEIEFFKTSESANGAWLDCLRRSFDAVLLDCPHMEAPPVAEVACLADAAVLSVEAGTTTKAQIQQDQRTLQAKGLIVAGCVLIYNK